MKKDVIAKIRACKELQGKTIQDILVLPEFANNFSAYWQAQKTDREAIRKSYAAMKKLGGAVGYKLPAHPLDHLADLTAGEMMLLYSEIIHGTSHLPKSQREYVKQLGQQAYNLTVAQIICREFPELEETLIPKSKTN